VDDDSGRLGYGDGLFGPGPNYPGPYPYADSALLDWHARHWGKTNEGWICPCAPVRRPNPNEAVAPFGPGPSYLGTVNSAWRVTAPGGLWGWWWWYAGGPGWEPGRSFILEGDVARSSQTPVLADGVTFWWVWPKATDLPAFDLETGRNRGGGFGLGMSWLTIPRHGSRPARAPKEHSPQERLPGAINVAFYDGHAGLVPLERLWQLEWHRDYQAPAKRPGLR
jgi:prepilin-type processing-associated H-X9-DG protein